MCGSIQDGATIDGWMSFVCVLTTLLICDDIRMRVHAFFVVVVIG